MHSLLLTSKRGTNYDSSITRHQIESLILSVVKVKLKSAPQSHRR